MSFILGIINSPTILAVIAGIGAFIAAYFRGRSDGKTKERAKQIKRDIQTMEANNEIIDKAHRARIAAGADDGLHDEFERTGD